MTIALFLLIVTGATARVLKSTSIHVNQLLSTARGAYEERRYRDVVRAADQILEIRRDDLEAIILGGAAAAANHDPVKASEFYSRIESIRDARTANATCVYSHLLAFELHRFSEAETIVKRVLAYDPVHAAANSEYANLLGLTGRRWEAIVPTIKLIQQGQCSTNQLILVGSESGGFEDATLLKASVDSTPSDSIASLGVAWQCRNADQIDEARKWAERAVQLSPDLISAQALLGSLLLEKPDAAIPFARWHAALHESAEDHPEIWLVRGRRAQLEGKIEPAIRCYWETIRRNPNYRIALYQLSQLLLRRGETAQAEPFLKRCEKLQRLKEAEAALFEGVQTSLQPIRRVAEELESLGRYWEILGWCHVALQLDPHAPWIPELTHRAKGLLTPDSPLTVDSANPACRFDFSVFPAPHWSSETTSEMTPVAVASAQTSPISFRDDASALGIDFTYFNSADARTPGQQMYEFSGGGVGGIDYDLDGWCDLYFTQGCHWPVRLDGFDHLDRLYKNCGSEGFEDVTDFCGIRENRFGQGLAIGDYDNDGFPDLFVGNIGGNRLYHNQGDGTFTDATHNLPKSDARWTTSCAMADLNGDGFADIYAANYLKGPDVFDRICHHKDGVPRMCAPFDFEGAQDQFYLSAGDGHFVDATTSAGFAAPHGKGLGLLIADFEQRGRLSVFVANDLVPNLFFANRTSHRGGSPVFEEIGLANGTGFDADGRAQGCMGIAVDDFNGDGWLDLFVTNFYMESNTLYLQQAAEMFTDATAPSGLVAPSLPMLGFGTQSVDADLDGIRDLFVTNGHVDDHRAYGQPYAMRPQLFRGRPGGRFQELAGNSLGSFFRNEYLGRGVARLDWNRDGREDLAISHLNSPAGLLTNSTATTGHSLTLQLRGVISDRDAIGAKVTLRSQSGSQTRQLTAGDGYQSCNQRSLVFGIGQDNVVDEMLVRWPSGMHQVFLSVRANHEWMCIEQRPELVLLSATAATSE